MQMNFQSTFREFWTTKILIQGKKSQFSYWNVLPQVETFQLRTRWMNWTFVFGKNIVATSTKFKTDCFFGIPSIWGSQEFVPAEKKVSYLKFLTYKNYESGENLYQKAEKEFRLIAFIA